MNPVLYCDSHCRRTPEPWAMSRKRGAGDGFLAFAPRSPKKARFMTCDGTVTHAIPLDSY